MRAVLWILRLLQVLPGFVCGRIAVQQTDSSPNTSDVAAELKALCEELLRMQRQMAVQPSEIEELKRSRVVEAPVTIDQTTAVESATEPHAPSIVEPAYSDYRANLEKHQAPRHVQNQEYEEGLPLSFRVGDAVFTPGGFFDLENIYRTTNTQSNIATRFATIPFSDTPQGHLSEFRSAAPFSRLNLQVASQFGCNDVLAYREADFSGNDATNVHQSVNGHTLRLRLCFMDLKRGKWEILAGQTWSWLTPNRSGVGPMPADLGITCNEDQNIGVGLPYTRAAEFRAAYHFNDHWAAGVGMEQPNQIIGAFIALPAGFATTVSPQFDKEAQIGAPNLFPDILAKIAHDATVAGRHLHPEGDGLITGARAGPFPAGNTSFSSRSAVGGGGQVAGNYERFKNFSILANAFWNGGRAHYLIATGPQLVIRPNPAGIDVKPSRMHAEAALASFEWIINPQAVIAAYYGADYYQRNFFPDTTSTAHPGTIIGYGGPDSPNINNRAIQRVTFDGYQTFWKSPRQGAPQCYTRYSHLTHAPWSVALDSPKNAPLSMVYAGVRYVWPITSGTLLPAPYPN